MLGKHGVLFPRTQIKNLGMVEFTLESLGLAGLMSSKFSGRICNNNNIITIVVTVIIIVVIVIIVWRAIEENIKH